MAQPVSLWTLFWIFFRIACTSFGGFMAMISVVENVVVERKKLMAHHDILDGISLASLLPGPVAVNLVVYVGYRLRAGAGALVSALGAVLPSFAFIVILSVAYFRWGQVPAVNKLFMGFIPAVTAIIVSAAWNMSRKSVAGVREGAISLAAFAALLEIGGFYSTLGIIVAAGTVGWLLFREAPGAPSKPDEKPTKPRPEFNINALALSTVPLAGVPLWSLDPSLVSKLFAVFAGMSVMLFGGGYVFIPLIQEIVVSHHKWVTTQEFVDAIAMGQVTPGPILVSAAFIGLKVAGFAGAVAATAGIYLPPALLMVTSTHALERIKRSVAIQAALRGVRPAVIGMIFAAAVVVGRTSVPVWYSVLIFVVALYVLVRWRLDAVWIIPAAGAVGWWLY
ncbi:MAG TPA: chromate efflux transporter [Candidatus Methylomirabilis sp.]|nr:chromate efflux transporter [Candidatus Methylomirabilis sp.]